MKLITKGQACSPIFPEHQWSRNHTIGTRSCGRLWISLESRRRWWRNTSWSITKLVSLLPTIDHYYRKICFNWFSLGASDTFTTLFFIRNLWMAQNTSWSITKLVSLLPTIDHYYRKICFNQFSLGASDTFTTLYFLCNLWMAQNTSWSITKLVSLLPTIGHFFKQFDFTYSVWEQTTLSQHFIFFVTY